MANQQPDLPHLVRSYVHYDNLVNNYTKQAGGARKLRDQFEDQIIKTLRTNRMENAVIQIAGATLQCTNEKSVPSLSMPRLEQYLHGYYAQKGNGLDETDAILRYIRLQKTNDTQLIAKLKKTPLPTPLPQPPGPVGGSTNGGNYLK
jgi:hypothetical protein